jgi:hypothetical protein
MDKFRPFALCLFLAASAVPAAGGELQCPDTLTADFPLKELYRCTSLARSLCIDVCGSRYEDFDVREAWQLPKGEHAVVCQDPSVSVMKNGSPYADDRRRHGCYDASGKRVPGGASRTWCVQLNNEYGGRKLGGYLQCAGRLDPDYVPQPASDGENHSIMLLEDAPKTIRVGSESTGDDLSASYRPPSPPQAGGKPVIQGSPIIVPAAAAPAPGENVEDFGANPFEKRIAQARADDALAARRQLAAAVRKYRAAHGGELPKDLLALVPDYIKAVPELEIPGYRKTRNMIVVQDTAGSDIYGFIRNTGGWLYVTDGNSHKSGAVILDSLKKYRGKPLYEY